ncbi:O-methyltransferase [Vulgatibacter incomptus]|uniref:O-methyltransferase n=1 Tax=Vulgatibacter incomptus TaxID=1391653 RepID=A0A0K1PDE9_9BACT|nr:class I SAM-dependent methyltransferase [Vulgatibacter incomptus]AKU91431.1 O-methyltransferase [Vulgatibacter incomptus]
MIVDEKIEAYSAAHSSPLPPLLDALAERTRAETTAPQMMVGRLEGNVLRMLVSLTGAKRVVEIGTFTGYSALCMANALPADGELVTCEIEEKHASIARDFFDKSPDGSKIRLRMGPAIETLRGLPEQAFDLVFIDADKEAYPAYYEESMRILRHGGLIVADNVLWSGRVLAPGDASSRAIVAFNERVRTDDRVEQVLLTVRDGMMLARKK